MNKQEQKPNTNGERGMYYTTLIGETYYGTQAEKQAMREAIKRNDPNAKFAILGTLRRMEREGR